MINFHIGRPRNPCEWHTFDDKQIITGKNGEMLEPRDHGRLIQHLRLAWWAGISGTRSVWFFGITRWKKANPS